MTDSTACLALVFEDAWHSHRCCRTVKAGRRWCGIHARVYDRWVAEGGPDHAREMAKFHWHLRERVSM